MIKVYRRIAKNFATELIFIDVWLDVNEKLIILNKEFIELRVLMLAESSYSIGYKLFEVHSSLLFHNCELFYVLRIYCKRICHPKSLIGVYEKSDSCCEPCKPFCV